MKDLKITRSFDDAASYNAKMRLVKKKFMKLREGSQGFYINELKVINEEIVNENKDDFSSDGESSSESKSQNDEE